MGRYGESAILYIANDVGYYEMIAVVRMNGE